MMRNGLLALVCTLVVGQAASAQTEVPQLSVESYRLDNGLKVALHHDARAPKVTVCVTYHVGSKNERAGLTGFAHFFEHMMFRGTQHVPHFDVALQQGGGSPNAFTSQDVTVYFESVASSYVERTLYMEAERMAFLPSALDQAKFDTEREVVKNERRQMMENVPYGLASEAIYAHLFPAGHPYSWSVIGSMRDLDNASLGDLRRFFYEFYHPGNATLAVVGNFDTDEVKGWIKKYFGPLQAGPETPAVSAPEAEPINERIVQKDQVQFPRVYWSWPTVPETHPDAAALDLLASVLVDGDASRLEQALVIDRRLASDVTGGSETMEVDGKFTLYATAAPGSHVDEIEAVLGEELQRLRDEPPTPEEVKRALAKHENRVLTMLTSTENRAFAIGMGLAQHDDPHYYQRLFTDYAQVTPADIQRVARQYLTPEKLVLVVDAVSAGEDESEAILTGPLARRTARRQVAERQTAADELWDSMPEPSAASEIVIPKIERRTLSNGLNVWVSPWQTLPMVSVRLVVPAGSGDDPEGQEGLASLVSQTWDKGTRELTATEFATALDTLGVSLAIGNGSDETYLQFSVGTSRLDETLELVGQLVEAPRFAADDVQRERELMRAALARLVDNPAGIAARVFPGLLYGPDHPYGSPDAGFDETLARLDAQAARQFYEQHFRPEGSTLIVVGDVDADALVETLESAFASWQGKVPQTTRPAPTHNPEEATVYMVNKPGAVQSVLMVGRPWRSRDDDTYFGTMIGNRLLGGDFLSRLNQNLRERHGYTYGAFSRFRYRRDGSDWLLMSSVRADVTGAALVEMVREMDAPLDGRPFTAEEVNIGREAQLNTLPEAFETPSSIVDVLADMAIHDLPDDYLEQAVRRLRAIDVTAVSESMRPLLDPEPRRILVVGDLPTIIPQLKQAGFTRLRELDIHGQHVAPVDR